MFDKQFIYLIKNEQITPEVKALLNKRSRLKSPYTGHYSATVTELAKLQDKFEVLTDPAAHDGIFNVSLRAKPEAPIHSIGWDDIRLNKDKLTNLVIKLAKRIGKFVALDCPNGVCKSPISKDDKFHIHIWSSPESGSYITPRKIWGHQDHCQDSYHLKIWELPEVGVQHIFTPEGDTIASFDKRDLYIYFDVAELDIPSAYDILEKIFDAINLDKVVPYTPEQIAELNKKRYAEACTKYANSGIRKLQEQITLAQNDFEDAKRHFVEATRNLNIYNKDLLKVLDIPSEERYLEEYEKLQAHPDIESIQIDSQLLNVYTRHIFMKYKEFYYDIGKFEIAINLATFNVKYKNLTRSVSTAIGAHMQHPHVYQNGHQCQGTAAAAFGELIANHEYGALIDFAISFLKQANVSSDRYMNGWPKVDEIPEELKLKPKTKKDAEAVKAAVEAPVEPEKVVN